MRLNELKDNAGATHSKKRIGRGIGSGKGKTGGRGVKGQKSRSGVSINGYEGGQMPIHMRLPKRGFNKPNRKKWTELTVANLERAIAAGKLDVKKDIDTAALLSAGVIRRANAGVRLIGKGKLSKAVKVVVAGASAGAIKSVEDAKGSVTISDALPEKADIADAKPVKAKPAKAAAKPAKATAAPKAKADDGEARHTPYFKNITEKYDADADEDVVKKITAYLGASLNNRDAKYVACTDAEERKTVRTNFLKKKLGLTDDDDALEAKVVAVCQEMKGQRLKDRVTFYYLLAKNEGKLGDL